MSFFKTTMQFLGEGIVDIFTGDESDGYTDRTSSVNETEGSYADDYRTPVITTDVGYNPVVDNSLLYVQYYEPEDD